MMFNPIFLQICVILGVVNGFQSIKSKNSTDSRLHAVRIEGDNHQSHIFHFFFPFHAKSIESTERNDEHINQRSLWLGHKPLFFAVKNGYETIVNSLIEENANVNVKDEHNWTVLHYAALGQSWAHLDHC